MLIPGIERNVGVSEFSAENEFVILIDNREELRHHKYKDDTNC